MGQDWLVYWKPWQFQQLLKDATIDHAAGEQLSRTKIGDRLWLCGIPGGRELVTAGFLRIAEKFGKTEARRRFGTGAYDSRAHVVPGGSASCPVRPVGLAPIYPELRFISTKRQRLTLTSGHPSPHQLQSIRRLTPASARLVEDFWLSSAASLRENASPSEFEGILSLAESLDVPREVITRLEQQYARELLLRGAATASCALCGQDFPAALLVAAHLKPRSRCTDAEKRDLNGNTALMCKLGCDDLFERGYLVVREGRVRAGKTDARTPAVARYCNSLEGKSCPGWNAARKPYFDWKADAGA